MARPPPDSESRVERRAVLGSLLQGTCALAALCAGCGPEWREATVLSDEQVCGVSPGRPEDGWVEVKLSDHPELRARGGSAVVRRPDALLDALVLHTASGCFAAVWHICTHGDCHVTYVPGESLLECPCHGSRFGEDGRVLRGPATRPLPSFKAVRVGESVWLHRPR